MVRLDSSSPLAQMSHKGRYTPAIVTGLAIGLVGLLVAGVVGSPSLGFAEQYEAVWEIPDWGSSSFPSSPQGIALGDQAVLLRTLHIFLDYGLAYLVVPPLFLCSLLKLSDLAKRFILARAASRTMWLVISFNLGAVFAGIAATVIMPDEPLSIHDFVVAACHFSVGAVSLLWQPTEFHCFVLIFFLTQLVLCAICKFRRVERAIAWFHRRAPYLLLAALSVVAMGVLQGQISQSLQDEKDNLIAILACGLLQFLVLIFGSGFAGFFLWCKWTASRLRESES